MLKSIWKLFIFRSSITFPFARNQYCWIIRNLLGNIYFSVVVIHSFSNSIIISYPLHFSGQCIMEYINALMKGTDDINLTTSLFATFLFDHTCMNASHSINLNNHNFYQISLSLPQYWLCGNCPLLKGKNF